MYQNNNTDLLVVGLLFGAAVGVAVGFLLAPQAGNKTRDILREGIANGVDRIQQLRRGIETGTEETKAD